MTKALALCLLITDLKFRGLGCFLLWVGCGAFFFPSPKNMTEMQNEKANHHTSSATLESF